MVERVALRCSKLLYLFAYKASICYNNHNTNFVFAKGENSTNFSIFYLGQYRIILSADTASEVRQLLSQKRR